MTFEAAIAEFADELRFRFLGCEIGKLLGLLMHMKSVFLLLIQ
jgi:hypothetical protein